jgi:hypothetical protein
MLKLNKGIFYFEGQYIVLAPNCASGYHLAWFGAWIALNY